MYRIDNETATESLPTPGVAGETPDGFFTKGAPEFGIAATVLDADWCNAVQEELAGVIEAAGLTLDKTDQGQLLLAIKALAVENASSYAASTTAANTYVATLSPVPAAYTAGMVVFIKFTNHNTGAATINLNSLGAKDIKNLDGTALVTNNIYDGMIAALAYDGTNFQLLNPNLTGIKTDVLNNTYRYASSASSPNTYTATLSPVPTAYTTGMTALIKFTNANTSTTPTINLNSLGAKTITHVDGTALQVGEIAAGMIAELAYDGTNFQLLNPAFLPSNANLSIVEGRLTLTSGLAVTTSDVTAATSVYFTPYRGNKIHLYNGTTWNMYSFTELTLSVPATTNTMYDVFIYDNAGTLTLEAVAWTNDTTRATTLATQNGVYVKNGTLTKRYLGSFRTTGSSGQTEDSLAKRYLWNYYNRIKRAMKVVDTTDTWNWSTASFQQANANAANQLDFIIGVSEDIIESKVFHRCVSSSTTYRIVNAGIGLDNTSNIATVYQRATCTSTDIALCFASYEATIAAGRHYLTWLEKGAGADTQTWVGDNAGVEQTGIFGNLLA